MRLSKGANGKKLLREKWMHMLSGHESNFRKMFKKGVATLVIATFWECGLPVSGYAATAPTGGVVTSGTATINQSGTTTNINQSTSKASINWQGFSIGTGYTVNFNQPSASSITLNRVIGNEQSVIQGALNANGKVFILNPNGVLLTKGATVNTGGFLATTLSLSDKDFQAGNYTFKSNGSTAAVTNQGTINAADDGYVALLGTNVSNQGIITATKGTVALAAGDEITLNFNGDSLISVTLDKGTLDALVENKQAIYADGGTVIMTAKAADALLSAQVNNGGIIQAQTIGQLTGKIVLNADGGTTNVAGTLDASAPNGGNGGSIETSGDSVLVADGTTVTTKAASGTSGTWTIDPTNFTIASGSAKSATSGIGASTLDAALELGSVSLATSSTGGSKTQGNLYVNADVSWDASTTLSLTAAKDLYVNDAITASGNGAGLTLTATSGSIYDNAAITMSGSNDTLTMNANTTSGIVYINNAITMSGDSNDAVVINAKDYSILTPASYSGTTSDGSKAKTDTSNGTYGSLSFTSSKGSSSGDSLTINNVPYTLIYSMSQLDNLDGLASNVAVTSVNGLISSTVTAFVKLKYLWNPKTQAYDILYYYTDGNGVTWHWDWIAGGYVTNDQFQADIANINKIRSSRYFYDLSTQKYDIVGYDYTKGLYYDQATGKYDLSSSTVTTANYYYDPATKSNDLTAPYTGNTYSYNSSGISVLNPVTGTNVSYYYYDSNDGMYDITKLASPIGNYALAANLNASGTTYYNPLTEMFSGTLNGFGHTINSLTIIGNGTNIGLIGQTQSGSIIRDLGIVNASITNSGSGSGSGTGASTGTLAGDATGTTFLNDWATGTVNGSNNNTGGLIGSLKNGYITSSFTDITVKGSFYTGGLVGSVTGSYIANSDATEDVTGNSYVGGLIGTVNDGGINPETKTAGSTITHSYATGNISTDSGTGEYVGGLIGYDHDSASTISYSFATGNVLGYYSGGLVGANWGTISYSYATGGVSVSGGWPNFGGWVGGLVGGNNGSIDHSYATGAVTSDGYGGGLAGGNNGSITNSYATGTVTGSNEGDGLGGLAGANYGTIASSYATGNVINTGEYTRTNDGTVANGTGGLVGSNEVGATITDSYATGEVNIGGSWVAAGGVGALVGSNGGAISGSTATGSVESSGVDVGGGLVGLNTAYSGASGIVTNSTYTDAAAVAATLKKKQTEIQQADAQSDASNQSTDSVSSNSQSLVDALNPMNLFGRSSATDDSITYADSDSYSAHVKAVESEGVEYQLDDCVKCTNKNKKK